MQRLTLSLVQMDWADTLTIRTMILTGLAKLEEHWLWAPGQVETTRMQTRLCSVEGQTIVHKVIIMPLSPVVWCMLLKSWHSSCSKMLNPAWSHDKPSHVFHFLCSSFVDDKQKRNEDNSEIQLKLTKIVIFPENSPKSPDMAFANDPYTGEICPVGHCSKGYVLMGFPCLWELFVSRIGMYSLQ